MKQLALVSLGCVASQLGSEATVSTRRDLSSLLFTRREADLEWTADRVTRGVLLFATPALAQPIHRNPFIATKESSVGIETKTYIAISVVMFLEFAIWGAWAPVLATRLLGPLKMSGKQTGWIYATLPLACIVAPLISGWLADQIVSMKYILIGAHLVGRGAPVCGRETGSVQIAVYRHAALFDVLRGNLTAGQCRAVYRDSQDQSRVDRGYNRSDGSRS